MAQVQTADVLLADWLGRIRAEYLEVPGLSLTLAQARRFWGLDDFVSRQLFTALVDVGFLRQTRSGTYVRGDKT